MDLYEKLHICQRRHCYLCGGRLPPVTVHSKAFITLDHIVPRSAGGTRQPPNVALAHSNCNTHKANRMPRACERLYGEATGEILRFITGFVTAQEGLACNRNRAVFYANLYAALRELRYVD